MAKNIPMAMVDILLSPYIRIYFHPFITSQISYQHESIISSHKIISAPITHSYLHPTNQDHSIDAI